MDLDYIETYFKNKRKYVVSGESQEQSSGWVLQVTFDFQTIITGYVTKAYDSKNVDSILSLREHRLIPEMRNQRKNLMHSLHRLILEKQKCISRPVLIRKMFLHP